MKKERSQGGRADPQPETRFWMDLKGVLQGQRRDYTSGSIARAILLLAVPMVLEMVMQSVFAVVDVFFVARLGADAVAVVGMTDSLLTLVFAVAMGLSMGTTAMVARRIGEKDDVGASNTAVQGILLGVLFAVPTGFLGILYSNRLLTLMGGTDEIIAAASGYAAIILGGNITVMLLFLINAVFRGAGDAVIAMRALWLANLINIVLDPILIFGWGFFPELGIDGAAWATTIGRGLGVLYQFSHLLRGSRSIRIRPHQFRLNPQLMKNLLRVASVGMVQFLIGTASWLGIMRILAVFGGTALAGYTIAVRVIIFTLLPSWGMGNAAATLVGQNLGAGKPHRAERSVWITGISNSIFLGIVAVLFNLVPGPIVRIFSSDSEVVAMGVDCLSIVSFSYVFLAFGMVTVQAFNGAGDTTTPAWINFLCYWCLQIPLAYLLALPLGYGPRGIFVAIAIAQSMLAVVSVLVFKRGRWKERSI